MKSLNDQRSSTDNQQHDCFFVIGIGASAGGQVALTEFFDYLSPKLNVAIVIITHLSRTHKSILNKILAKHTSIPVIRIDADMPLEPGKVYVMKEDSSVTLEDGWLRCRKRDAKIVNQNVDLFFESMAKDLKSKALGIILSGGGSDGLKGTQTIDKYGGHVLAQHPSTAQVDGMPRSVITHDHPASILSPAELARKVNEICRLHPDNVDMPFNE